MQPAKPRRLKLRFLRAAHQRRRAGLAGRHHLLHGVEVAGAHKSLVLYGLVAVLLQRKFALLQLGIAGHAALAVGLRQLKHAGIERVKAG